jgi:hypothetical protein
VRRIAATTVIGRRSVERHSGQSKYRPERKRENIMKMLHTLVIVSGLAIIGLSGQGLGTPVWTTLDYPTAHPNDHIDTEALGIDGGKIVGTLGGQQGFLYDGTDWSSFAYSGSYWTSATDVSGSTIIGTRADKYRTVTHGFVCDNTGWTIFDHPDATSTFPQGMSGTAITGYYIGGDGVARGFLYDSGNWTTLNYPGARITRPFGISGNKIVGTFDDSEGRHGFVYDGTTWAMLDFPGASSTTLRGVSGNIIVGDYHANGQPNPFYYDGTTWTTIESPEPAYIQVRGIDGNNIVGSYVLRSDWNSYRHGFVLTVPEPTTLSLLALGGLLIARRRRA